MFCKMKVIVMSPEKTLYSDIANSVVVPGTKGAFEILENHAPIISSLQRGIVQIINNGNQTEISAESGFVEVSHNEVSICIEQ